MRIMALDVGDRRIGVAISDPTGLLARQLTIIKRTSEKADVLEVLNVISKYSPGKLIVGLPLSLNGLIGSQAQKVNEFCQILRPSLDIPLEMYDESFSSVDAQTHIKSGSRKKRSSIKHDDDVAAMVFLQSYLNERHVETESNREADTLER